MPAAAAAMQQMDGLPQSQRFILPPKTALVLMRPKNTPICEQVNFAFTRSRRSPTVSRPAGDCFFVPVFLVIPSACTNFAIILDHNEETNHNLMDYNFQDIEKKWQARWAADKT